MSKVKINFMVKALETAVVNRWVPEKVRIFHDRLLKALRETDKKGNLIYPNPDWDQFPNARTFFTQNYT